MFLLLFLLSHINGIPVPIMSYPDHPAVGLLNGKHRNLKKAQEQKAEISYASFQIQKL